MDRADIVQGCKKGDSAAKEALYNIYARKLSALCRKYVDSPETAQDLTHDAFIIIYSSIGRLQDPSKLESWMGSIVRNIACDYLHKEGRFTHEGLPLEMEDVKEDSFPYPLPPFEDLMKMIDSLPERYGKVFRLSVLDGLSHQQIGNILNIAERSSSSNLSRARQILQDSIRRYWFLLPVLLLLLAVLSILSSRISSPVNADDALTEQSASPSAASPATGPVPQAVPDTDIPRADAGTRPFVLDARPMSSVHKADSVPTEDATEPVPAEEADTDSEVPSEKEESAAPSAKKDSSNTSRPVKIIEPWTPQMWEENHPGKSRKAGLRIMLATLPARTGINHNATSGLGLETKIDPSTGRFGSWTQYYSNINNTLGAGRSGENLVSLEKIAIVNQAANESPYRETTHYRPVISAGITASYGLGGRFSLTLGARYSALSAETNMGMDIANVVRTDKVKYLGIPAGLSYEIWSPSSRLHFMTATDVMAEFCMSAKWKVVHSRNYLRTFLDSGKGAAPTQWSVGAGLGVQFDISPEIGLYLQPQMRYYFRNSDGSVRTVHSAYPWNADLSVGVRWNL